MTSKQIQTLHPDYRECILDIDIFGRVVSTPQQSLEEMKEALFEEFKIMKPMPTLEARRYELSRLVSPDYHINYSGDLELQDNESLIDLACAESSMPPIHFEDLSGLIPEVQESFTYEEGITDDIREQIIKKYDLSTGEEFKPGILQTENIVGSVVEDAETYLSDEAIDKLGSREDAGELAESSDEPDDVGENRPSWMINAQVWGSQQAGAVPVPEVDIDYGVSAEGEGGAAVLDTGQSAYQGDQPDDSDSYDIDAGYADDEEEESDEDTDGCDIGVGFEDDEEEESDGSDDGDFVDLAQEDSDEEEESDDGPDEDSDDGDFVDLDQEDSDSEDEGYFDMGGEESSDDFDEVGDEPSDDEGYFDMEAGGEPDEESGEESDEGYFDMSGGDEPDEESGEEDEGYFDMEVGGEPDEESDEEDDGYFDMDSDGESDEEQGEGDEDEGYFDMSDGDESEEDDDTLGMEGGEEAEEDGDDVGYFDIGSDEDDFTPEPVVEQAPVAPPPQPKPPAPLQQSQVSQPQVVDRSAEPTEIRAFLRKYPRSDIKFVLQYFTKKQIEDAIKMGRINRKGNILRC